MMRCSNGLMATETGAFHRSLYTLVAVTFVDALQNFGGNIARLGWFVFLAHLV